MLELNQRLVVIDRGLDLRANPAWCAVRELMKVIDLEWVSLWLRKGVCIDTGQPVFLSCDLSRTDQPGPTYPA